jgi:exodeoxyribonuclease V gamma subunit
VWRAVRDRVGVPSPAERIPSLLHELRSGVLGAELPDRVAVFGMASLSPGQLAVAEAIATTRDVHLLLRVPSPAGWTAVPRVPHSVPVPRADLDVGQAVGHPLLASWGRPALETAALVKATPAEHHELARPAPATPPPVTLLRRVQEGLRLDQPPPSGVLDPTRRADLLAGGDGSVQVHACHGPTRQVEVLHDALLHLFRERADLRPRDVLVLCPDLDSFAPLVAAVFEGRAGEAPRVPVRVGDRTLTTVNPVAAALQAVLDVVTGRATAADITSLAASDPVRRRFGLTDDDLALLDRWAGELGVRWGLRAGDRVSWGVPGSLADGTWRSALDRLLVGVAMAAPTPRVSIGGVAPFDDIAGGDVSSVGKVAELLARLERTVDDLDGPRPVSAWCDAIERLVDRLLAPPPDARWQWGEVLDVVADLRAEAVAGGRVDHAPVELGDLAVLLARRLAGAPARPDFRSGAVTVTSLVPQRGVPAEVVCILGLDDAAVRASGVDGDDILLVHPCIGERDARAEARQLLLDAVLAAEDVLIVTCTGHDVTSNQPVPFPVALEELLDVVAATLHDISGMSPAQRCSVLTHHPRQGFDDRALGVTRPGVTPLRTDGSWAFDPLAKRAAIARRRGVTVRRPPVSALETRPLPALEVGEVTLDELVDACLRPADVFMEQRLGARPPSRPERHLDALDLSVDALTASQVGRELLAHITTGGDAAGWLATRPHLGNLPPAALGAEALVRIHDELRDLVELVEAHGGSLEPEEPREVEVFMPGGPAVTARVTGGHGDVLTRARYVRWRPGLALGAALELAVLTLADLSIPWSAVVAGRDASSSRTIPRPHLVTVRLAGDDACGRLAAATELLARAVELHARALCEPLPLFERSSHAVATGGSDVDGKLRRDRMDGCNDLVFPGVTVAALDADPVRAHDPVGGRHASRWRALAAHLWDTVARTTEGVA